MNFEELNNIVFKNQPEQENLTILECGYVHKLKQIMDDFKAGRVDKLEASRRKLLARKQAVQAEIKIETYDNMFNAYAGETGKRYMVTSLSEDGKTTDEIIQILKEME